MQSTCILCHEYIWNIMHVSIMLWLCPYHIFSSGPFCDHALLPSVRLLRMAVPFAHLLNWGMRATPLHVHHKVAHNFSCRQLSVLRDQRHNIPKHLTVKLARRFLHMWWNKINCNPTFTSKVKHNWRCTVWIHLIFAYCVQMWWMYAELYNSQLHISHPQQLAKRNIAYWNTFVVCIIMHMLTLQGIVYMIGV